MAPEFRCSLGDIADSSSSDATEPGSEAISSPHAHRREPKLRISHERCGRVERARPLADLLASMHPGASSCGG